MSGGGDRFVHNTTFRRGRVGECFPSMVTRVVEVDGSTLSV